MFALLLKREIFSHFLTGHFYIAMLTCLLLVVPSTITLISDYKHRVASYHTAVETHQETARRSRTYSTLRLNVDRPPNPLSLLNQGLDRRLGNMIEISHNLVPTLFELHSHSADNPFLNLFSSIDLVFIFQMVLSLLALLFAYDSIAGERQHGTLRLMMSTSVRRGIILLAKYVAAMICLILPLTMSLLVTLILLIDSGVVTWNAIYVLSILGILITSVIYLSTFYLIGLLISALAHRTATALTLCIFIWATLTLIYPNVVIFTMKQLWPTSDTRQEAFNELAQIWEHFKKERTDFLKDDPVKGESWRFNMTGVFGGRTGFSTNATTLKYVGIEAVRWGQIDAESEKQIPHVINYYQFIEPLRIRTAQKTWRVRQEALEATYLRKTRSIRHLLRLSPTTLYDLATEALAGTCFHNIDTFIAQARQYRQSVIQYFYDKAAFASREWFAFDAKKVSWEGLPTFSFQRTGFQENLKRALPDVILLLIMNIILFMSAVLIFIKQDV